MQQQLPGVGENLQDHLTVNVQQGLHGVTTFYEETRPLAMLKNLFKYLFKRRGLLAHPASQVGVFFRTSEQVTRPMPRFTLPPPPASRQQGQPENQARHHGHGLPPAPESRGSVHIRCRPARLPGIRANYLDTENDRKAIVAAVRRVRDIFAPRHWTSIAARNSARAHVQSDEEILSYVRAQAESVYHPVGTCKMGSDDMAVVDDRLRVHGVTACVLPMRPSCPRWYRATPTHRPS